MDLHKGRVSVESEGEGHGCTFSVDLPVVPVGSVSLQQSHLSGSFNGDPMAEDMAIPVEMRNSLIAWESSEERNSRFRILLVDDSAITRKMMVRSLGDKFKHIDEALDGADALSRVRENMLDEESMDYKAVLMDHQMPNMDGPTAAKEMRALGYKGLIIGITGDSLEADMDFFLSQGANLVLSKPVDMRKLVRIITGSG